ncbi:MAG: hypothetical protein CK533_09710 [Acidobacterium sp.]|nr:hypothetical protein [Acidobacteriota bacterium]PHY10400.1 MAG: hypothetical protein CK533_09710 [Acidobacterium sp.]
MSYQLTSNLTPFVDAVAAVGTTLLLGVAAMPGFQPDPAAASALFDSPANGSAVHRLAQDRPSDARSEPRVIEVVASRFAFEPARIEVTEGEHIRLLVSSADGVHGVGIKKFRVEKTLPRGGEAVIINFVASAAGEYPILCSEYCGKGHEEMRGLLVVAARK